MLRRWLSALALGLLLPVQSPAEPLRLYTEEYPPINFSDAGEPAGLSVELVRELARRSGLPITVTVVAWARAYGEARTRPDTGVFVAVRTVEHEPLFQWVGPITVSITSLYGLTC